MTPLSFAIRIKQKIIKIIIQRDDIEILQQKKTFFSESLFNMVGRGGRFERNFSREK